MAHTQGMQRIGTRRGFTYGFKDPRNDTVFIKCEYVFGIEL